MKLSFFILLFCGILFSCSTQENGNNSGNNLDEQTTGGPCQYDKHSIYISVDSIVPVAQLAPDDTARCADCQIIFYHALNGERLISSCIGDIFPGENKMMNNGRYYRNDFISENKLEAKSEYLMKIEQIVKGTCTPCVFTFTKK